MVATPWWIRAAVWLCLPITGAGVLLAVDRFADRWVRLSWAPWRWVGRLIHQVPEPQATVGVLVVGVAAGLVLAFFVDQESLTVRLSADEIVLTRPGVTRVVPRADVAVAFRDRDRLVLLGRTGRELAREPAHLAPRRLAARFTAHGVPWAERDPYADAYRRWVPGLPDVPDAVFAARDKAVRSGDSRDAEELRGELARLGYVVRDDRRRQYFRPING